MRYFRTVLLKLLVNIAVLGLLAGTSTFASQTKIHAIALFQDKAMLSINGGKGKVVAVGATFKGVKLIESTTKRAVIEYAGKQEILTLDGSTFLTERLASEPDSDANKQAILFADNNGFFRSEGVINGQALPFIVDTGANLVVMSGTHADSIGVEYLNGEPGYAWTASGQAPMFLITLDEMSFEGISVSYVEAGVIEGDYPQVPLLGMSFLENLEMNRNGDRMVLKKR